MFLAGCGYEAERGVGLERVGDDVVAHFVLCRADRVTEFRLTDYGLSYGSGLVGPVLWELRSDDGERIERIRFGEVPAGFDETVRYHDVRSVERVVVSDHNGDDMMSYAKEELGAGASGARTTSGSGGRSSGVRDARTAATACTTTSSGSD